MSAPESRRQKLLIVDDQPTNLKVLGEYLRQDYEIAVATRGEEALCIASGEKPPELILLDVGMPHMDGFEVCARLKEDERTKTIPVIFITGKDDDVNEAAGIELGAVDYIAKPFSMTVVKARIRTHLIVKQQSDLLKRLAFLDGLTDIPNRRHFDDLYDREWRRALRTQAPLSVIFTDVDDFKRYNDFYGHAAGDECLKVVAMTLKTPLYRATDIVARYGGEEFVTVLPDTPFDVAMTIAEKMRNNIESLGLIHDRACLESKIITASFGIATAMPTIKLEPAQLLKLADNALYEAKQKGKNQAVGYAFSPLLP